MQLRKTTHKKAKIRLGLSADVRKDERFIQFLRNELAKHLGRLETNSGAKIEMCEAGVSYDYSNNGEWRELNEQISYYQNNAKLLKKNCASLLRQRWLLIQKQEK